MMISQIPTTLTSIGVFTLFGSTTVPPQPVPLAVTIPQTRCHSHGVNCFTPQPIHLSPVNLENRMEDFSHSLTLKSVSNQAAINQEGEQNFSEAYNGAIADVSAFMRLAPKSDEVYIGAPTPGHSPGRQPG